jgi:8-oxo-dGTP pyrophosphatase MutT (NUDIX family)
VIQMRFTGMSLRELYTFGPPAETIGAYVAADAPDAASTDVWTGTMSSRWEVHSEKPLYTDEWLDIRVADVELPDGRRLDHRLIRTRPGAGVAMIVDGSVLLLWRHRFITGTWGWEVPLGKADPGEDPQAAAAREAEEETGWRPGPLRPLLRIEPTPGISDSVHHVFRADTATHIGPPPDAYESDRVAWVPLADIPRLAADGKISSGTTLSALLYALTQPRD